MFSFRFTRGSIVTKLVLKERRLISHVPSPGKKVYPQTPCPRYNIELDPSYTYPARAVLEVVSFVYGLTYGEISFDVYAWLRFVS